MTTKTITTVNGNIVIVNIETPIINDGQSALDFIMSIGYEHDCQNIAINKAAVAEDFFVLSTGIAGDVVQKFVNYGFKVAIIGDFSGYTSKPLHDFIYESNKGNHLCFVADETEAVKRLSE